MFAGLLDITKSFQVYDSISSYCIVNCGLSLLHDLFVVEKSKTIPFYCRIVLGYWPLNCLIADNQVI